MKDKIQQIKDLIQKKGDLNKNLIQSLFRVCLKELTRNKIDKFIGDFPSFLEPVHLEDNVKIEDDVLLGPKVFIGSNTSIGEFSELSNCIVLNDVSLGKAFKLENCIIAEGSQLNFEGQKLENCIIRGSGKSLDEIELIKLD
ncbi:MAG: hypothetical protein P8Y70_21075 [Candidatus Lokiarchaeota archaeon]